MAWGIIGITIGLLLWQYVQRQHASIQTSQEADGPTTGSLSSTGSQTIARTPTAAASAPIGQEQLVAPDATSVAPPAAQVPPSSSVAVPETPELSSLPAQTVLDNMRITIRQYAAAFGENPVGTNPEITSALQGANPKQINFLKADGNRVNAQGELVDVWGTPYFFHQLSAHEMEIRSAGPDRVMYTGDDLVTR